MTVCFTNSIYVRFVAIFVLLAIGMPFSCASEQSSKPIPSKICGTIKVKVDTKDLPASDNETFHKLVSQQIQDLEKLCETEPHIKVLMKKKLWTNVYFGSSSDLDSHPFASTGLFDNGDLTILYYKGELGNKEVLLDYLSGRILPESND